MDWCTIESDPGVFTELMHEIGVKGVQMEEVYSIDVLESLKPVYGLIFLFKWTQGPPRESLAEYDPELFFANQKVQNACATQAMLSVLLNHPDLDIGETLRGLKEFTMPLNSSDRGLAIGSCEKIRVAHNSFSRSEFFEFGKVRATEKDDVYHFISYIYFNGAIYELDGLQPGPIRLRESTPDTWLTDVKPAIMERMSTYSASEIRFNLLAVVNSRRDAAVKTRALLLSHLSAINAKLSSLGEDVEENIVDFDEDYFNSLPNEVAGLKEELKHKQEDLKTAEMQLLEENELHEKWAKENARRKHNYIPLILELLDVLAERKELTGLLQAAKDRQQEEKKKKAEATPSS